MHLGTKLMAGYETLRPKQRAFLRAMAETGNITVAAAAAKITRQSHYRWMAEDSDGSYAAAFKVAEDEAADLLEKAARQRAVEGWEEPVFYQGEQTGSVRKYSDTLLIFMLKGAKPEKYKERGAVEHTGANGGPIQVQRLDLTKLSDEELDALDRIVDKGAPDLPRGD